MIATYQAEYQSTEPEKAQKIVTKKADAAAVATAALTAAADGDVIMRKRTSASEAQGTKDEDEEILALMQERKMTKNYEKERIQEVNKKSKKCNREKTGRQDKNNSEDFGKTQGHEEHLQYQGGEKANSHPNIKNKKREIINTRTNKEYLNNSNPSQTSQKTKSKMLSTASRKAKKKTAVEYELSSSKNAVTRQRRKSEKSLTKSRDKKIARRRVGEKFVSKSSTRMATEKTQEITDQYAAYQYCTSCLPPYYMHASPHSCKEFNNQTKVGFGPTTELKII